MNEVDTVLFDKTGTLTRERPEVGRVIASAGHTPEADPPATPPPPRGSSTTRSPWRSCTRPRKLDLELPPTDDTQYKVGYGITVQIDGRTIRVGSKRFMELEGMRDRAPRSHEALDEAHRRRAHDGHGRRRRPGSAAPSSCTRRSGRRSARSSRGCGKRGIKHIAIISGDHEAPTRKLAESLGMDRYFAQVLPADKADYVEKLQKEGKKVCFVGDGINDSIALKKANVSISLRGASSIATDTAHIVFMEEGLSKLCDLRDIARDLDRNVKRSWTMILAPNIACIAGVFTMGFGIMASVAHQQRRRPRRPRPTACCPCGRSPQIEAEKKHEQELRQAYGLARKAV